jgi:hypothetical protein
MRRRPVPSPACLPSPAAAALASVSPSWPPRCCCLSSSFLLSSPLFLPFPLPLSSLLDSSSLPLLFSLPSHPWLVLDHPYSTLGVGGQEARQPLGAGGTGRASGPGFLGAFRGRIQGCPARREGQGSRVASELGASLTPTTVYDCRKAGGHRVGCLVLPDPDHLPACVPKRGVVASVSCLVAFDLLPPVIGVRPWSSQVLWTAVPETTVDEDRDPLDREHHIWTAPQTR